VELRERVKELTEEIDRLKHMLKRSSELRETMQGTINRLREQLKEIQK